MKKKLAFIIGIFVLILNINITAFAENKALEQLKSPVFEKYYAGGIKAAESEFKILKKRKDVSEYTYVAMMTLYMEENNLNKAISIGNEGVKKFPQSYVIYNLIGAAYNQSENYDGALSAYTKSIEIKQTEPAYYNRGRIWSYIKNDEARAIADYTKALECLEIYKNDPATYNSFASDIYGQRATAYAKSKNLEKAIADYDMVIKCDKTIPGAYFFRAKARFFKLMNDLEANKVTPAAGNATLVSVADDLEKTMKYAREKNNPQLYNDAVEFKNIIVRAFGKKS